jgi:hypothetical protein
MEIPTWLCMAKRFPPTTTNWPETMFIGQSLLQWRSKRRRPQLGDAAIAGLQPALVDSLYSATASCQATTRWKVPAAGCPLGLVQTTRRDLHKNYGERRNAGALCQPRSVGHWPRYGPVNGWLEDPGSRENRCAPALHHRVARRRPYPGPPRHLLPMPASPAMTSAWAGSSNATRSRFWKQMAIS